MPGRATLGNGVRPSSRAHFPVGLFEHRFARLQYFRRPPAYGRPEHGPSPWQRPRALYPCREESATWPRRLGTAALQPARRPPRSHARNARANLGRGHGWPFAHPCSSVAATRCAFSTPTYPVLPGTVKEELLCPEPYRSHCTNEHCARDLRSRGTRNLGRIAPSAEGSRTDGTLSAPAVTR